MEAAIYDLKLTCSKCGYTGKPAVIYIPDPSEPTDTVAEPGCPNCKTDRHCIVEVAEYV